VGHVARMRNEKVVQHFGRKPKGKRLLARSRRRCEDNIKLDLKEIRSDDWIQLAQNGVQQWAVVLLGVSWLVGWLVG
jgi:hypothetical protein